MNCLSSQLSCLAEEVVADEVPAVPSYISERYKVGRMLGDGNFAVVHECAEHSTGRHYALKIINKGKCRGKVRDSARNSSDPTLRRRFRSYAQT